MAVLGRFADGGEILHSFITSSVKTLQSVTSRNGGSVERRAVYANTERHDEIFATAIFGWTLGFTALAAVTAWKQTRRPTVYIILCWLEIAASLSFGSIAWSYLMGFVPRSLPVFFFIVVSWALQLNCLAQIIVNRICVLIHAESDRNRLKWATAGIILLVNIGVFIIWIPAQLEVSRTWHVINLWYDRAEKVIMLIVDAALNYYFIHIVKKRLVGMGLTKYDKLVRFNQKIIILSILMDIMIIAFMSYPNPLIYTLFHPVAYSVKLQIEMTMSELIIRVARAMEHPEHHPSTTQSGSGLPESDSNGRTTQFTMSRRTSTKPTSANHKNGDGERGLGNISVTVSHVIHEDDASGRTVDLAGDSDSEKIPPLNEEDENDKPYKGGVVGGLDSSFIEMDRFHPKPVGNGKSQVYFTEVGKD